MLGYILSFVGNFDPACTDLLMSFDHKPKTRSHLPSLLGL